MLALDRRWIRIHHLLMMTAWIAVAAGLARATLGGVPAPWWIGSSLTLAYLPSVPLLSGPVLATRWAKAGPLSAGEWAWSSLGLSWAVVLVCGWLNLHLQEGVFIGPALLLHLFALLLCVLIAMGHRSMSRVIGLTRVGNTRRNRVGFLLIKLNVISCCVIIFMTILMTLRGL